MEEREIERRSLLMAEEHSRAPRLKTIRVQFGKSPQIRESTRRSIHDLAGGVRELDPGAEVPRGAEALARDNGAQAEIPETLRQAIHEMSRDEVVPIATREALGAVASIRAVPQPVLAHLDDLVQSYRESVVLANEARDLREGAPSAASEPEAVAATRDAARR